MRDTAAATAGRARKRDAQIARYLDAGGPDMTNAEAGRLLRVSVRTIAAYRAALIAAGTIDPGRSGPNPTSPCGTDAAYRRHLRNGEKPCPGCQQAEARRRADVNSTGQAAAHVPDHAREKRNNMPDVPYYRHRARRYPWAERAIAAAEAEHGAPESTCVCGSLLPEYRARYVGGKCETCQPALAREQVPA